MIHRRIVIDDHLLLRVLLDDEPTELRPHGGQIFTTGLWYHRLCRAISDRRVSGVLSRSLGRATPAVAAAAVRAATTLPSSVGLVSLRDLAWPMARLLDDGVRLNLMSLEALAAVERVAGELCMAVADDNEALLAAAAARSTPISIIG